MVHKSLAMVLGIGPLLLIQAAYPIPFFTAVNLLAPFWMLIFLILIVSFLSFDTLAHAVKARQVLHLLGSIVALLFLVSVPGIFVALLTLAENSKHWEAIAKSGFRLPGELAFHWLFRFLHVLGAAIVLGSAYHYFSSAKQEGEHKLLLMWMMGGILFQLPIGLLLTFSLPKKPNLAAWIIVLFGALIALALLRSTICSRLQQVAASFQSVLPLLIILLVSMLLARQLLQDQGILPLQKVLSGNAAEHETRLKPYTRAALDGYQASLQVSYYNPETLYSSCCAFCHGKEADGKGTEAETLSIPPGDLSAIRTTRSYFTSILKEGVSGTAMPPFTFLDRYRLYEVMEYLDRKYGVFSRPEAVPFSVSPGALAQAQRVYEEKCSGCHGGDGGGSGTAPGLVPAPPNLTEYSLSPERTFAVITNGYPGTSMPTFADLAKEVRWGLVKVVQLKRNK